MQKRLSIFFQNDVPGFLRAENTVRYYELSLIWNTVTIVEFKFDLLFTVFCSYLFNYQLAGLYSWVVNNIGIKKPLKLFTNSPTEIIQFTFKI